VASFGAITLDNRRVLAMEWIAEAVTMLFIGVLVAMVTLLDPGSSSVSQLVYRMSAAALAAIGALTAVTGARTPVIWFKACPLVMSLAVALILIGSSL
jgi:hypothetical protein